MNVGGKIYRRKLEGKIGKFLERREMIGIKGARQVGKTTLMKIIYDRIDDAKAFINLDLLDMKRTLEENPLDLVRRYKEEGKKLYLFLDEIQRVKSAGEKLKVIYDEYPDVKIIFSGSSSLELKTNILSFLVGRAFIFELFSFDFEEFLQARDQGLAKVFLEKKRSFEKALEGKDEPEQPSFENEFLNLLNEYLVYGGYPEVVKTKDRETKKMILKNIASLYIEKDVITFFGIRDTSKFEDLLKMLAFKTGSILSISSFSSALKTGFKKIGDYIEIMKHSYIIHLIRPFYQNLVTEIRKSKKFYFLDLGLRNSLIDNFLPIGNRSDAGNLLENFVFRELLTLEDADIRYWRTTGKAEIDFIVRRRDKIIPIEVKLSPEKPGKGFYSFISTYQPENAFIITLKDFHRERINSCDLFYIPAYMI